MCRLSTHGSGVPFMSMPRVIGALLLVAWVFFTLWPRLRLLLSVVCSDGAKSSSVGVGSYWLYVTVYYYVFLHGASHQCECAMAWQSGAQCRHCLDPEGRETEETPRETPESTNPQT